MAAKSIQKVFIQQFLVETTKWNISHLGGQILDWDYGSVNAKALFSADGGPQGLISRFKCRRQVERTH